MGLNDSERTFPAASNNSRLQQGPEMILKPTCIGEKIDFLVYILARGIYHFLLFYLPPWIDAGSKFRMSIANGSKILLPTLAFSPLSFIPLIAFLLFFVLRPLRFSSRIAILRACSSISIYLFNFVGVLGSGFAGARPPRFPPLLIFSLLHPLLPCFSSHRTCAGAFIYFGGGAVGSGVRW
jgi:hypothetical protein